MEESKDSVVGVLRSRDCRHVLDDVPVGEKEQERGRTNLKDHRSNGKQAEHHDLNSQTANNHPFPELHCRSLEHQACGPALD